MITAAVTTALLPLIAFGHVFPDISPSQPYAEDVRSLAAAGIVRGYPDGTFRPESSINRAEFLTLTLRAQTALSSPSDPGPLPFSDTDASAWYAPSLRTAIALGLVRGYPDGTFRPAKAVNGAEALKILSIAFGISSQPSTPWYQGYVDALQNLGVIPESLTNIAAPLTRGQMATLIARLRKNTENAGEDGFEVVGWIPYWDQENAIDSFRNHASAIDAISLFWYRLDPEGGIRTYDTTEEDSAFIQEAHALGKDVYGLIANLPDYTEGGDWDPERVTKVIATGETRRVHIEELIELAKAKDFDGIDIDYEALPGEDREDFSAFIRELAAALHAEDFTLGLAIHSKTSEDNPEEDNGSHAQDWQQIAKHADRLYFMTYDEHTSGDPPGPIASLPWIERTLRYAVEGLHIPPEKIVMGIPLYAQGWEEDGSEYRGVEEELTLSDVERMVTQGNVTTRFDESAKSPSLTIRDEGTRVIWYEDERSIGEKLKLARRYGIMNLGLWRLGGETEEVWGVLSGHR
ncbi:MAG: glycosyl hydrolase family 18 protein [Candidatus Peregrinibacteria bacterium]|nr:glycosyl hydrolase family 18 protein [Candidatus Peregrinibacteria bacterium]